MKARVILPIILSMVLLTSCGNKYVAKVGNQEIYKTNIKKVSHNDMGDWVLSGTTNAPEDSKVLVTVYDKESDEYGANGSESAKSPATLAIVQDGKFKVNVNPVILTDRVDQKIGGKTKLLVFAVKNYNRKWVEPTIPKNIVNNARKSLNPKTVSMSKSQNTYIKNLNKNNSKSKTSKATNTTTTNNNTNSSNGDKVPSENKAALEKAKTYSNIMHLSRQEIYDQLTSEAGENFPATAAQYAVDHLHADYNANALATAKNYRKEQNMSDNEIREQLTSEAGEQFTQQEADYAIQHLND